MPGIKFQTFCSGSFSSILGFFHVCIPCGNLNMFLQWIWLFAVIVLCIILPVWIICGGSLTLSTLFRDGICRCNAEILDATDTIVVTFPWRLWLVTPYALLIPCAPFIRSAHNKSCRMSRSAILIHILPSNGSRHLSSPVIKSYTVLHLGPTNNPAAHHSSFGGLCA